MADQPRKILKIKTSGLSQQSPDATTSAAPQSAVSGTPKLKLTSKARFSGSPAQEPEPVTTPKTTLKLKVLKKPGTDSSPATKKRDHDEAIGSSIKVAPAGKKKLRLSIIKKASGSRPDEPQSAAITTPFVRFKVKEKFKKKARLRQKGYAYDSEASDREDDPIQQWNFILRMGPGEDAEWIQSLIEKRELEKNKQHLKLRFLQEDGRRAMLTVRNKTYAAILVDLPCIIESMKGWDKKGWYKSADIHQMLLVLGTVTTEHEALKYPIPKAEVNDKTWAYAHGLTPPMHWVRKRRFRKRISTHAIQDIEEAVRRLLEKDALAEEVSYEIIDRETLRRQEEREAAGEEEYFDDEDGEMDFEDMYAQDGYGAEMGQEDEDEEVDEEEFQAQFESFMAGGEESQDLQDTAQTPGSSSAAAVDNVNGTDSEIGTPAAAESKATSDDDDDDDDEGDEEDESEKEERVGFQRAREEISELESAIKEQRAEMERVGNPLLKARIRNKIQVLQADLELKKAAVGDEEDDDDD